MRLALALSFLLTGCKTATVDQILIKSPNWLPGVDIYLDIEDDARDDIGTLLNSDDKDNHSSNDGSRGSSPGVRNAQNSNRCQCCSAGRHQVRRPNSNHTPGNQ